MELRNLFKDLAVMVDYQVITSQTHISCNKLITQFAEGLSPSFVVQGQYTSSIERNLTIARDEIKDTGSLLKEARAMKRSARSKKVRRQTRSPVSRRGTRETTVMYGLYLSSKTKVLRTFLLEPVRFD